MLKKFIPAAAVLLAAGPVFAQGQTQTPPAPTSATTAPQSANSLPPGAANMNMNSPANPYAAGQAVGGTTTTQTAPTTTLGGTAPRP